jgi:sorbitol/mannitol transport system permease protein
LILFTSLKSLDAEQKEAASIDGPGPLQMFFYIIVPHLQRAIGVVVMIETIFLLSIFAEIYTTTSGGPGHATTNLAFLVFSLGIQPIQCGYRFCRRDSRGDSGQYRCVLSGENARSKLKLEGQ